MRIAIEDAFTHGEPKRIQHLSVSTSRTREFPCRRDCEHSNLSQCLIKNGMDMLFEKAFVFKNLRSASCGKAGHHAHLLLNGHNFNGPIWRLTRREQPASQQTQVRKEVTSISVAPNWAREPFFEVFVVTGPPGRWVFEKVVLRTRTSSDMPPFKPAKQ